MAAVTALVLLIVLATAVAVLSPSAGLRIGQPAPDFTLESFDGQRLRLADLSGSVVVLNFWASWCVTCAEEAPLLEQLWQNYRQRGVLVIGVDYMDTPAAARAYLERHGITYPNGPDRGGRIARLYRVTGVPETLVIDRQGRVVPLPVAGAPQQGAVRLIGPLGPGRALEDDQLRQVIDRLLDAETQS